jgi:hypothetical protein
MSAILVKIPPFADGESDKAGTREAAGNEQQNEEHDQQFDRDQQHSDAHAGLQRDVVARERFALKRRESSARIGEGIDAHAERRHGEASSNTDHAEQQDDEDVEKRLAPQDPEVNDDDDGDEAFQQHQKLTLGREVSFARFIDQLGDFAH